MLLFHLKSSFRYWDIQIFVFPSFALFLQVDYCFGGPLLINLKVYDAVNCLNKDIMTHCLISWEGKKVWHWHFVHRWSIKQKIFSWENHAEKLLKKLVPYLFIIFVNNPKQLLHARNSFKKGIMKEAYKKTLTKVTLVFLSNPVPFNEQNCQKQTGPGTSDQSLFRLRNKFRKFLY